MHVANACSTSTVGGKPGKPNWEMFSNRPVDVFTKFSKSRLFESH